MILGKGPGGHFLGGVACLGAFGVGCFAWAMRLLGRSPE